MIHLLPNLFSVSGITREVGIQYRCCLALELQHEVALANHANHVSGLRSLWYLLRLTIRINSLPYGYSAIPSAYLHIDRDVIDGLLPTVLARGAAVVRHVNEILQMTSGKRCL